MNNNLNNYQLYRTNAKLGGQVAWNLVLEDTADGELAVKYFDLTPISPNVTYKYGQNRDCIRYRHQENLRTLYNEIKGQFYDAVVDPRLTTIYPIIDDEEKDTRDSSLEMGCSRLSLSRYGKQLQVFCPVWLEDFKKDDVLSFVISLYSYVKEKNDKGELVEVENILSSRRLLLKPLKEESYHDRFVDYFRKYLNDIIEDDVIGDDVLNINITDKFASIHGLDIKTGNLASKDISDLVPNLFERERPLMETDFMLIDNYHTSTMVAKQLFNFNLIFDIADLVSNTMNNMLKDDDFFIKVDVSKYVISDDKETEILFEKRSFNNNYSSLEKPNVSFYDVFKYLQDDKCIDTIRDNKLAPDICHWTLNDNTNYIFNVYPGFGLKYDMFYKDSPNYWEYDVTRYPNALNWINCFDLTKDDKLDDKSIDTALNKVITSPDFTTFNVHGKFVKDSRVDPDKITEDGERVTNYEYLVSYIYAGTNDDISNVMKSLKTHGISEYVFIVPGNNGTKLYVSEQLSNILGKESIVDHLDEAKNNGYVVFSFTQIGNHYVFLSNPDNKNLLSYKWMIDVLPKIRDLFNVEIYSKRPLRTVIDILNTIEMPKFIYIYNSIGIKKADSPWIETDEIYYVKVNKRSNIVIRYDGKIKPMFSEFSDLVMYRVRKMTADEFSSDPVFQKEQTQGFLPNYPSTGYFNLEFVDESNYHKYNEYKWFNDSLVFNLVPSINVKLFSKHFSHYYTNEEMVDMILISNYPNLSSKYMTYLRSLYKVEISYEYDTPAWNTELNRFDYIYTIKLELK